MADQEDGENSKVIVYNDDRNTFKNVINLLSENTHNNPTQASLLAESIDEHGRATVYEGKENFAKNVRDALKDGGLHVELINQE